jgi:hypothetical protein
LISKTNYIQRSKLNKKKESKMMMYSVNVY